MTVDPTLLDGFSSEYEWEDARSSMTWKARQIERNDDRGLITLDDWQSLPLDAITDEDDPGAIDVGYKMYICDECEGSGVECLVDRVCDLCLGEGVHMASMPTYANESYVYQAELIRQRYGTFSPHSIADWWQKAN